MVTADLSAIESQHVKRGISPLDATLPGLHASLHRVVSLMTSVLGSFHSQIKFCDNRVVVYAYSNYSTLQDTFVVARVNDFVKILYYKDG